ncbi:MAG: DUF1801 domain-containing protein [Bryobacteraceae bacterium]
MNANKPTQTLAQYLEDKDPEMVRIARGVQKLVRSVEPGMKQTMNSWNIPMIEKADGPFCLFRVAKAHVSLMFTRATSLPDPQGLLEGTGKNMRHVKLKTMADLKREGLRELVVAAANCRGGMR